eukprot:95593_1
MDGLEMAFTWSVSNLFSYFSAYLIGHKFRFNRKFKDILLEHFHIFVCRVPPHRALKRLYKRGALLTQKLDDHRTAGDCALSFPAYFRIDITSSNLYSSPSFSMLS